MTKEELEKEAEGYTNKLLEDWELYDPEALQEAYIAGAEPREKRIAELEQHIEKMKRCEICKHYSRMCGCSYHSTSVKNCKENGMKLFELKEIKEKC